MVNNQRLQSLRDLKGLLKLGIGNRRQRPDMFSIISQGETGDLGRSGLVFEVVSREGLWWK